ncbi:MAG: hypothetical protein KDA44_12325 [Planctomycetales bacterium]|nr:hypothetical protein [Planctomycetales bacterium]
MSEKKPLPLIRNASPKTCPVCGHPSYSGNGIHPQCNGTQADKKRREKRAAEARDAAIAPDGGETHADVT